MLGPGEQAPAFELPDLEGGIQRLEDALTLGPVLAAFWQPHCDTCRLAFPYLQRLADTYPAPRWRLLAISQESERASRDFARQYGLTMPVLLDGEGWPVSRQYDPEATPTLFLIAPDGTIEVTSVGFDKRDLNEIARRLAAHLGEEATPIAEDGDGNPPFRPG